MDLSRIASGFLTISINICQSRFSTKPTFFWGTLYLSSFLPPTWSVYHHTKTPFRSDPRDFWPLRYVIIMMRTCDLIKKSFYLHTYPLTYLPTNQPTRLLPLENTLKEQSYRLVTYNTFDQSDEETCLYQKRSTYPHSFDGFSASFKNPKVRFPLLLPFQFQFCNKKKGLALLQLHCNTAVRTHTGTY